MLARITSSRKTKPASLACRERFGKRDEPRQHVGHLDARELGASAVADDHREVLAQVRDERERMAGIEGQRRQHRDRSRARSSRVRCSRISGVHSSGSRNEMRSAASSGRSSFQTPPASCSICTPRCASRRAAARCCSRPGATSSIPSRSFFSVADANHEELVEVGPVMPRNFTRSSSGMRRVAGLGEHALVELEPAQLAVDVERGVLQVRVVGPRLTTRSADAEVGGDGRVVAPRRATAILGVHTEFRGKSGS